MPILRGNLGSLFGHTLAKKKIINISPIADIDMPFPTAPNRGFTFPNYNCHLKGSSQKRHETTNYP